MEKVNGAPIPEPHREARVLFKPKPTKKEIIKEGLRAVKHDIKYLVNKAKIGSDLVRKATKGKLKYRKVMKKQPKVTIALNQPVVTRDKSRFFKEELQEDRRQLFFS